jgi:hypothetical protein
LPQSTFFADSYQEHGRTSRGKEKGFLPDSQATLAANQAAFLCPKYWQVLRLFF